jgi:hypothetical protein
MATEPLTLPVFPDVFAVCRPETSAGAAVQHSILMSSLKQPWGGGSMELRPDREVI